MTTYTPEQQHANREALITLLRNPTGTEQIPDAYAAKGFVNARNVPVWKNGDIFYWAFEEEADSLPGCGTVGCALGLSHSKLGLDPWASQQKEADFFGLFVDDCRRIFYGYQHLFYGYQHPNYYGECDLRDVTPEMVADALEKAPYA